MAQHRHKRETPAARPSRIPRSVLVSAPIAVVATMSAVTMGVLAGAPVTPDSQLLASATSTSGLERPLPASGDVTTQALPNTTAFDRRGEPTVSRSQIRTAAKAESAARRTWRSTSRPAGWPRSSTSASGPPAPLNLWDGPEREGREARRRRRPPQGVGHRATPGRAAPRSSSTVSRAGSAADYLAADKPEPEPPSRPRPPGRAWAAPAPTAPPSRPGTPRLYSIHDVVCANWPQITSYGTWRGDGEHGQGRAIDIMITGDDRLGGGRLPARQLLPRWASSTSSTRSTSGPWSAAARAGAACPTVGPRPPTTTTTCTSPSTESGRDGRVAAVLGRSLGSSIDEHRGPVRRRGARARGGGAAQAGGRTGAPGVRARPGARRPRCGVTSAGGQDPGRRARRPTTSSATGSRTASRSPRSAATSRVPSAPTPTSSRPPPWPTTWATRRSATTGSGCWPS